MARDKDARARMDEEAALRAKRQAPPEPAPMKSVPSTQVISTHAEAFGFPMDSRGGQHLPGFHPSTSPPPPSRGFQVGGLPLQNQMPVQGLGPIMPVLVSSMSSSMMSPPSAYPPDPRQSRTAPWAGNHGVYHTQDPRQQGIRVLPLYKHSTPHYYC